MNQRESAIQKIDDVLGMSQPLISDQSSYTIKKWVRGEVEQVRRYLDHHIHGARKRGLQESMNASL